MSLKAPLWPIFWADISPPLWTSYFLLFCWSCDSMNISQAWQNSDLDVPSWLNRFFFQLKFASIQYTLMISLHTWAGLLFTCLTVSDQSNQVLAELSLEWEMEIRTCHSNSMKIETNYIIRCKDMLTTNRILIVAQYINILKINQWIFSWRRRYSEEGNKSLDLFSQAVTIKLICSHSEKRFPGKHELNRQREAWNLRKKCIDS